MSRSARATDQIRGLGSRRVESARLTRKNLDDLVRVSLDTETTLRKAHSEIERLSAGIERRSARWKQLARRLWREVAELQRQLREAELAIAEVEPGKGMVRGQRNGAE